MNYGPLNDAIRDATEHLWTYPSSYREIREDFVGKGKNWQANLASSIGISTRQVQRYEKFLRGETGQTRNPDNVRGATKEKLIDFGKTLEPIKKDAPKEGLTFVITFNAPGDKGHAPRERTTPESGPDVIHLDYNQAVQYINQEQPQYDTLFDEWFDGGGDAYGEDGDYEADVTGVVAY